MSRRSRSFNAFEQATTAAIDDAVTSIPLDSVTNLTPPGYLVIDPDDPLKREYIFYTTINALVLENVSRGLEGSAGGVPQEHSSGARVRAVSVHQWLNDIFDDIEDLELLQSDYLLLDGSRPMVGNLDMGSTNRIVDLANGLSDQDAATVKQVTEADLLLLPLDGTRPMTGALKISLATGGQIELEDPGGAAPDTFVVDHDEGITNLGTLLTLDNIAEQVVTHKQIKVEAATTQETIYSIAAIELGADTDAGGGGRVSIIDMHAGGANTYDARIIAQNGTIGTLGDGDLDLRARSTAILSDAGAGLAILSVDGQVFAANNLPGSPSFTFNNDSNTGMYRVAADVLGWSAGSNRRMSLDNDSLVVGNDATAAAPTMHTFPAVSSPAYAFNGDLNMGMNRVSSGRVGLVTGGVQRVQVSSAVFIATPAFTATTASAANVNIVTDGQMRRSTSSMKVKKNLAPIAHGLDVVRKLNPLHFDSILEGDEGVRFTGFGAEEVVDVIPTAENGENYDLRSIVAYLVAAVKELAPA